MKGGMGEGGMEGSDIHGVPGHCQSMRERGGEE